VDGVVRRLTSGGRVGWVATGDGPAREIYSFRARDLAGVRYADLSEGQAVRFELKWDAPGRRCWAVAVRLIEEPGTWGQDTVT